MTKRKITPKASKKRTARPARPVTVEDLTVAKRSPRGLRTKSSIRAGISGNNETHTGD